MLANRRSSLLGSLLGLFAMVQLSLAEAETLTVNGREFSVPDGLVIELAAAAPLTERPITADFDELGRLYVAESSGSNESVQSQLEKKPHSILRLTDTDGDGIYDERTVFADKMMFPEGTMWLDGSLYVSAPPQIWKLTDTDDDGVADRREVWFDAKTLTGCANDLHGPYLGPDGWIYWCKGAFAEQTYERPGREPWVTRAAHIFRRRPEGGPVEPVMTGGMDNPVDVVFSAGGERFFTTTFLTHPQGEVRDGIIHAIYGGVYGKDHGVISGHPRTGELMPPMIHLGAAAPCGLTHLQSNYLGDASFSRSLLACQFNRHRVSRHILRREGGTYTSSDKEFVSSKDLDFHPTDVLEDADGSVLIVDTGGWYKLCCPTSQLYKPDVPGAIYRIRRRDAPVAEDPRGRSIHWSSLTPQEMAKLVADDRHAVRKRAAQSIQKLENPPYDFIAQQLRAGSAADRLRYVWAIVPIDDLRAKELVRSALRDEDQDVRSAATHGVAIWRDADALDDLHRLLSEGTQADLRAAAEAVGRIGSSSSVQPLLGATDRVRGRVAQHSVIFALIEINDAEATKVGLQDQRPRELAATLIALDQMQSGAVEAAQVVQLLDLPSQPDLQALRSTAWWIIQRHPEWADLMAVWFRSHLKTSDATRYDERFVERLAMFAGSGAVQSVMAKSLQSDETSVRMAVMRAMARCDVSPIPASWSWNLARQLESSDPHILAQAVATVRALAAAKPTKAVIERVQAIASRSDHSSTLRLRALAAAAVARQESRDERMRLTETLTNFVCQALPLSEPAGNRATAIDVLAGSALTPSQFAQIADVMPSTGPMEVKRLLSLFEQNRDDETGLVLVSALTRTPAATSLDPKTLERQLAEFGRQTAEAAKPLISRIERENKEKIARIEAILAKLDTADERRGQEVFHSTKTSCIACHQMGFLGGNVGPSLNGIGKIRSARDLLESILFPSISFVRSYEPTSILTADGRVISGLVRDETPDELVLAIDAQKTVRVKHDSIEERQPGKVSIMPAGLDQQLSDQQLADLIRFLKVSR